MDKHKQVGGATATSNHTVETTADAQSRSSGFPWLFLAGVAIIAIGAGLTVMPSIAHDQAWIASGLAKHGFTGAPIALTGLVLCALWTATRPRRELPAPTTGVDRDLLLEQIASDMAQARGGMQDLRVEFVYLKDQVQGIAAQREMLEAHAGPNDAQSAMFGLAASMDQLAARLEQRVKAIDVALQESIGLLRHDVTATGACVAELRARIEEGMQSPNPVHDGYSEYHSNGERQIEIESGYRADADDIEVYVELEEPDERGLGLLDEIDDLGRHNTAKQSPSIRPSMARSQIAFDVEQVNAPIPSRQNSVEVGVDEKLSALRALMSDPNVREALEAARHNR